MQDSSVICLGCAFWDTIFKIDRIPGYGTKVLPKAAIQAASGMATAAAITIARLGAQVELWTRIGDDPTGEGFLLDLTHETVQTSSVRQVPGARTGFSTILVDEAGERLVVPYTDPALDPDPSWLPMHKIRQAGALLVDMRWTEGSRAVLEEARRCGVPTVVDADIAPVPDLRQLTKLADHVLFSEPALLSLTQESSPQHALRQVVSELDTNVVSVTLGGAGAMVWHRERPDLLLEVPALKVAVVDTLNAGDVWHGAYAYGLVKGWDVEKITRFANVAAAIKCERFGGRLGAPRLSDVLDRIDELPASRWIPFR